MNEKSSNGLRRFVDKVFGGLNMSWPAVVLFAVATAVLTAIFLIVPVFKETSFHRMGVTMEAWILFAVIIMANAKSPVESAAKVFVFFLISQPLIYLFQVPFSWMGWGLFHYYKTWFIWTLLTIPMAFIGWYINKKNWLSVVILLPVMCFLGVAALESFKDAAGHFPKHIVMALFCVMQILLYIYVFFPDIKKRLAGLLLTLGVVIAYAVMTPPAEIQVWDNLPDAPALSEEATISVEDASICQMQFTNTEEARLCIVVNKTGSTTMTVVDGDKEYKYAVDVVESNGSYAVNMTPVGDAS